MNDERWSIIDAFVAAAATGPIKSTTDLFERELIVGGSVEVRLGVPSADEIIKQLPPIARSGLAN